jgi:hypothetical protein
LDAEDLAIEAVDDAELRLADARRPFQDSVEHWCEVAGRVVDDLQDLGGSGLLSERRVALDPHLPELGLACGKLLLQIGNER